MSAAEFSTQGFTPLCHRLHDDKVDALLELAPPIAHLRGGVRSLFEKVPAFQQVLSVPEVNDVIQEYLGEKALCVRSILFDKREESNWLVPWHQDLSVAVKQRHDVEHYTAWSNKNGVAHVQPPALIRKKMLTLRIHLDECGKDNGALRVLPGTHLFGRMNAADIRQKRSELDEVVCTSPRGGMFCMNPMLLHASSSSTSGRHRRVLHLEFSNFALPAPLHWQESWACTFLDAASTAPHSATR